MADQVPPVVPPAVPPATPAPAAPPAIGIADFKKLEFKVGKVVEAAPHPNADRLLVLKVDVGGQVRQVVAGIKASYAPEQIVGKLVVVVANLPPATLRGVESQGMVMAASAGSELSLITLDRPLAPGSKVS